MPLTVSLLASHIDPSTVLHPVHSAKLTLYSTKTAKTSKSHIFKCGWFFFEMQFVNFYKAKFTLAISILLYHCDRANGISALTLKAKFILALSVFLYHCDHSNGIPAKTSKAKFFSPFQFYRITVTMLMESPHKHQKLTQRRNHICPEKGFS